MPRYRSVPPKTPYTPDAPRSIAQHVPSQSSKHRDGRDKAALSFAYHRPMQSIRDALQNIPWAEPDHQRNGGN